MDKEIDQVLTSELPWFSWPLVVLLGALFYFLWSILAGTTIDLLLRPDNVLVANNKTPGEMIVEMIIMPILVTWEEFVFRVPISLAGRWAKGNVRLVMLFVLAMAAFFGVCHSLVTESVLMALCVQGMGGVLLGFVYLTAGGYNGKIVKPFVFSYSVHVMMNWTIMGLALIFSILS